MDETQAIRQLLSDFPAFCRSGGLKLRAYQRAAANAVLGSVLGGHGRSIVVMFPRQSGKNELQAQLEAYLLALYQNEPLEMVKIAPTWQPQCQTSMRRLEKALNANPLTQRRWEKQAGSIYRLGRARILFFSGAPEANIVGATASLLLEVDEAQNVLPDKFDRDIAPMAASTNATRVFWGTAWTAHTLLGRELRAAANEEEGDGVKRVFRITADEVSAEVPAYARFVRQQVARFGRSHPSVRTQYYSEEIDGQAGLFPPGRMALLEGGHAWQDQPTAGETYAFLLDVGGEDRAAQAAAERREHDATALVIVAVEPAGLSDPLARAPTYRVVHLRQWRGENHTRLYAQIRALAERWNPRRLVVDATGLGAGLAAFLDRSLPGRVTRFEFNAQSKSRLGWALLEVVESGRLRLPRACAGPGDDLLDLLRKQFAACEYNVGERSTQALRWSVPEAARDPQSGALLHDDLLLAVALVARLDGLEWPSTTGTGVIQARDPLEGERGF